MNETQADHHPLSNTTRATLRRVVSLTLSSLALASLTLGCATTTQAASPLSIKNSCSVPIWVQTQPNANMPPLSDGIVKLAPNASHSYNITGNWAGRFWPKTKCDQNGNNCATGQSAPPCPTGGCQPPADTKVEFNFDDPGTNQSWYDISLVDGYSLPVEIVPRGVSSGSCVKTDCAVSFGACPQNETSVGDLRIQQGGATVGCFSPCKKWNWPTPLGLGKPETQQPGLMLCCPTPPVSPTRCSAGPVATSQYVTMVHNNCPSAYSYAYDDDAGLHACPLNTGFDVTFCP